MKDKTKIAIYPGTFDPITYGHIDIIKRTSNIFDKVFVIIGKNSMKRNLFTDKERLEMAQQATYNIENCEVIISNELTTEIAKKLKAKTIIRGIRAVSDFDYEFQIALINKKLAPDIHTLFMVPGEKYIYLSSSIVKELAMYNKNINKFVPDEVAKKLFEKLKK